MDRIEEGQEEVKVATDYKGQSETEPSLEDKLLQDFSSYTTLHGFHFLFDSNSVIRRLIWIVLLVGCAVFLVFQFINRWEKFASNLSVTSREEEKSDSLIFPAVSICNQNMMKKSKIRGKDAQAYLDWLDFSKATPTGNVSSAFDIEKAVRESGHQLSDMMKRCLWKGKPCGPENFTMFSSFTRGLCYTFNSGKKGHPLLNVTSSSTAQGLTLSLDAEPEEYYGPFSYVSTGFKVFAHDQKEEIPDMENKAQDVSPGFNTMMRIKREKILSLRSPFSSACGEINLTQSKIYSQDACLSECYTNMTIRACGCRAFPMPGGGEFNNSGYCSMGKLANCVSLTRAKFNPSRCDCPVPCEQVKFKAQLSLGYSPSSSLLDGILHIYKRDGNRSFTKEDIRTRLAQVTIFYETLVSDVIKERPAYESNDLASDIGGNMGMFLGCSVLTLCEFIDLIFIGILKLWKRGIRRGQRAHVQPH